MWSFLNDVRESVRQVVAPPPSRRSAASSTTTATSTTANAREMGFEEAVDQLTTGLLRLWRKADQTASRVLRQAFDGAVSLREEAVPRLFTLAAEARASLSEDELLELLIDAVSQATDRTHQALDEANFLLSLGIEEQIAHTKDYAGCYEWWDRTVNRRLIVCQELLQTRFANTSSTPQHMATVMALRAQMDVIRRASTQPLAAVAARGRLLEDERYDLLESLPAMFPVEGGDQPAHVSSTAPDDAASTAHQPTAALPGEASYTPSVDGVVAAVPRDFYIPQFRPFTPSSPIAAAAPLTDSATAILQDFDSTHCDAHPAAAHAFPSQTPTSPEERARLAREAEEQARLAREAEEQGRLAREAEEQGRLAREAEEQERLAREAEEQARLACEAEEQERLAREAEEQARLAREAEESAARAKLSRESQEVSAALYGEVIPGSQVMQKGMRKPSSSRNVMPPPVGTVIDDDGWGEDDGFEEVNMAQFTKYLGSPQRRTSWGGADPSFSSSPLSAYAQAYTPASAQRGASMACKKLSPPITPVPGVRQVGVTEVVTPTVGRRTGGMSLRKKSPPVRVAADGATPVSAFQPRGSIGGSSSMSSPYGGAANAASGAAGWRPAPQQGLFSSPSAVSKQSKRQVQLEDDDKWDEDW